MSVICASDSLYPTIRTRVHTTPRHLDSHALNKSLNWISHLAFRAWLLYSMSLKRASALYLGPTAKTVRFLCTHSPPSNLKSSIGLTLNVWAPANVPKGTRLPVIAVSTAFRVYHSKEADICLLIQKYIFGGDFGSNVIVSQITNTLYSRWV